LKIRNHSFDEKKTGGESRGGDKGTPCSSWSCPSSQYFPPHVQKSKSLLGGPVNVKRLKDKAASATTKERRGGIATETCRR